MVNSKSRTRTAIIFLQCEESDNDNRPSVVIGEAAGQPPEGDFYPQKCPPPPAESSNVSASWRLPRPDGRLRSVDWVVLRHLRSKVVEGDGNTTTAVAVREISESCQVSRRTAQNVLRRLSMQQLITPLAHASGSTEGRRYHLWPTALE